MAQSNGVVSSDHVSIALRGLTRHKRSKPRRKISIGFYYFLTLSLVLSFSAFFYFSLPSKGGETNRHQAHENDTDFLQNVTRIRYSNDLKFGQGSIVHGKDSRDWDKDDRRRDGNYSKEELERTRHDSVDKPHTPVKNKSSSFEKSHKPLVHRASGLYNESVRNELKMYEAEYEASLKTTGDSLKVHSNRHQQSDADEYDDGIDLQDDHMEEYDDVGTDQMGTTKPRNIDTKELSHAQHVTSNKPKINEDADKDSNDEVIVNPEHTSSVESRSIRKLNPWFIGQAACTMNRCAMN